ncbi:hypothetical protein DFP72DRAFT_860111 [Ephemerocybe angulata]|uniref:Uncharacterized protein n=1 Tax=Ephemerocybe angulata TaxID=980116 RepID=A0A8H6H985_9AGAR|nr:hypothetical protein DFP72DRAFT_860111 [Tulosesus angulatus]
MASNARHSAVNVLLRGAASGSIAHMQLLAARYPYSRTDIRPVQATIGFVRSNPGHQSNLAECTSTLQSAWSLVIAGNVVKEIIKNEEDMSVPSTVTLVDTINEYWLDVTSSIPMLLSHPSARQYLSAIIHLMINLTRSPFISILWGHPSATVNMVLHMWSSKIANNRHATMCPSVASLINTCLENDVLAQTLLDTLRGRSSLDGRRFYRAFTVRIEELGRLVSGRGEGKSYVDVALLQLGTYQDVLLQLSKQYSGAWDSLLAARVLVAYANAFYQIALKTNGNPSYTLRICVQIASLLSSISFDASNLIRKLSQLFSGNLAKTLYTLLTTHSPHSPTYMAVRSVLVSLTSYLPYSSVCHSVTATLALRSPEAMVPSQAGPAWEAFLLSIAYAIQADRVKSECFQYACDNLGKCQKEDWDALHRSECRGASMERLDRSQSRVTFPWGSRGNLAAELVILDRTRQLDMNKGDSIVIVDLRRDELPHVSRMPVPLHLQKRSGYAPPHLQPRLSAMAHSLDVKNIRLVEVIYGHGQKSYHVIARLWEDISGEWQFLNGVGLVSEGNDVDEEVTYEVIH